MGAPLLKLASTAFTTSGQANLASTSAIQTLAVGVNITAVSGTTPSLSLFLEYLGADGVWYPIWSPTAITTLPTTPTSTSVGPGTAIPAVVPSILRLRWAITGGTPSFTMSVSIIGRP